MIQNVANCLLRCVLTACLIGLASVGAVASDLAVSFAVDQTSPDGLGREGSSFAPFQIQFVFRNTGATVLPERSYTIHSLSVLPRSPLTMPALNSYSSGDVVLSAVVDASLFTDEIELVDNSTGETIIARSFEVNLPPSSPQENSSQSEEN